MDRGTAGQLDEDDEPCPRGIKEAIDNLIFSGDSDLALGLAERWSNEELTDSEQDEFGIRYEEV